MKEKDFRRLMDSKGPYEPTYNEAMQRRNRRKSRFREFSVIILKGIVEGFRQLGSVFLPPLPPKDSN